MHQSVLPKLLAFYGMTFLIKDSSILGRPRNWVAGKSEFARELLSCSFCTGFHAGYIVYGLSTPIRKWSIRAALLDAVTSAAFSYVLDNVMRRVEQGLYEQEPDSTPAPETS